MAAGPVPSSAVETESRLRAIEALVRDEVGTVHDGRLSQQSLDGQYAPVDGYSTAAQRAFVGRLNAQAGPAILTVLGDSTGNDATDWFRPFFADLGEAFPAWTVQHRLWSDTNQGYGPPTYAQVGTDGLAYLVPGSDGATTPDSASKSLANCDVMIRAHVRKDDINAAGEQNIASDFSPSAGNRSWRLYMTNGNLYFGYSVDGTTLVEALVANSAATAASFADGEDFYVGVQVTRDNGAGNSRIEAIKSTDGTTWSTFGTAVTSGAVITSLFNGIASIEVGSRSLGTLSWAGRIYWVEVYKGLTTSDPLAFRFDASLYQTGTTFVDAEGSTWTLGAAASITLGAPLLLAMNGSHPGATISYAEDATRQPKLLSAPSNMVIFNWGHNQTETDVQSVYEALVADVTTSEPSATIVVCRQNPQHSGATNYLRQNRHQSNIGEMAARNGYGVIDGYQAFIDTGSPDTYVDTNDVHPTTAGYVLWANAARRTFGIAEV